MNNTQELLDGAQNGAAPKATGTRSKPQKRGISKLLRADCRQIDGRSALGIAISGQRAALVASLGGEEHLSTQERMLVQLCARDWAILEQIDNYLLQVGLFSKRKKAAWPLVATRMQVEDGITKRLLALRLEKRARPTLSLNDLLNNTPDPAQAVDRGTESA
jgi:hypothetical protein